MFIPIMVCFALIVCILLNLFNYMEFRERIADADMVFTETRKVVRVLHFILIVLSGVGLIAFVVMLFIKSIEPYQAVCVLAVALMCFLWGAVPYSRSFWAIGKEGIYLCQKRLTVPYKDVINLGAIKRGKSTCMTLELKKLDSEIMKKRFYNVLLPQEKVNEARSLIFEYRDAYDRKAYAKKLNKEKNTPLSKRKFY